MWTVKVSCSLIHFYMNYFTFTECYQICCIFFQQIASISVFSLGIEWINLNYFYILGKKSLVDIQNPWFLLKWVVKLFIPILLEQINLQPKVNQAHIYSRSTMTVRQLETAACVQVREFWRWTAPHCWAAVTTKLCGRCGAWVRSWSSWCVTPRLPPPTQGCPHPPTLCPRHPPSLGSTTRCTAQPTASIVTTRTRVCSNRSVFNLRLSISLLSLQIWPSGKLLFECQKIAKNLTYF